MKHRWAASPISVPGPSAAPSRQARAQQQLAAEAADQRESPLSETAAPVRQQPGRVVTITASTKPLRSHPSPGHSSIHEDPWDIESARITGSQFAPPAQHPDGPGGLSTGSEIKSPANSFKHLSWSRKAFPGRHRGPSPGCGSPRHSSGHSSRPRSPPIQRHPGTTTSQVINSTEGTNGAGVHHLLTTGSGHRAGMAWRPLKL